MISSFQNLVDLTGVWLFLKDAFALVIPVLSLIVAFFARAHAKKANDIAEAANAHAKSANDIAEAANAHAERIDLRETEVDRSALRLKIVRKDISGTSRYYFSIVNNSDFKVFDFNADISLHIYLSDEAELDAEIKTLAKNSIKIESGIEIPFIDMTHTLEREVPVEIAELLNPESSVIPEQELKNLKFSILPSKICWKSEIGKLYETEFNAEDMSFYALAEGGMCFYFVHKDLLLPD